jgi:ligand-binding sensor domain-containing protein
MRFRTFRSLAFCSLFLPVLSTTAQERPIGTWRAHLPYNAAQGVASDGISLFTISPQGFFIYNSGKDELETFSKVEGMHESSTSVIGYDRATSTCIIGYANSNIDLYKNHSFKVLPDLKDKSFSGSKTINHIFTSQGFAYLSTGLGVLVIDLDKQEVKETYVFSKNGQTITVNAFTGDDTYFYAATSAGLYRINRNNPNPQVFTNWTTLDATRAFPFMATAGTNRVYAASSSDSIFQVQNTVLTNVFFRRGVTMRHLDGGKEKLYISQNNDTTGVGWVYALNADNSLADSVRLGYPLGTVETDEGKSWYADLYQGLGRRDNPGGGVNFIIPKGPNAPTNFDLYAHNGELWVAHGGLNDFNGRLGSHSGMSRFQNESWTIYKPDNFPLFKDSVYDILHINKNLRDGTVYAGTFNSGLIKLNADNSGSIYKQGALEQSPPVDNGYPATSSAFDQSGNLWVTQTYITDELAMRSPEGVWYHYPILIPSPSRMGLDLIIDDYDQKWFFRASGNGVIVYNDNGTPEIPADDPSPVQLLKGVGQGNLPNNAVRCLAKDRDGAIWIGTDDGIGIVNCPYDVITRQCEAELRIVQFDQFAGYLFAGQTVRAIAVDGGNRKWVGTSNGVWLLTPDANKIVNRFTTDNSPLPSNLIQSIAVDDITGDVYIGTDQGLVSYRGTATAGDPDNTANLQIFPNPVEAGYSGPIAIRGLVTDADVRITDIAGQLIYKAKATGGQLVWNGLDYTGHRPQSGVLLVFISNKDGSQKRVGKMVMMH